ncbi:hypothetical protein B0H14DRAFT_2397681, partial [Mycena olivaceomarginata]
EDDSPEEKMCRAGHKYVITEGLWFSSTAESVLETKLSQSYEKKNRFTNQSQKKQGELRAVHNLLPKELRGELRKEWAIFEFDKAMGWQRSNTSLQLRNEIEPVFNTHLKALDNVADVLDDAKCAGLANLIGGKKNTAGKITYHPLAAPVLHSDGSTSHNPEMFLHNKLVMHMLWMLSADTSLKKCGQQTAVNWHLISEQIHEWLLNGLRNRHEPVLRLFCEWDDKLFPDTEASLGGGTRNRIGQHRRSSRSS